MEVGDLDIDIAELGSNLGQTEFGRRRLARLPKIVAVLLLCTALHTLSDAH